MKTIISEFLEYLLLERGLAKNSILAYANDLNQFANYLEKEGIDNPADVTRDIILDFLENGRDAGQEISTLARRLVAIKMLFAYLYREKKLPGNITEVMDSPRMMRLIPDMLSVAEVDRLLRAYTSKDDPLILRNRAILEVLYASGLRASELITLRLDGIDFKLKVMRVIGKGSKERLVPFGASALRAMQRYLERSRPALDKSGTAIEFFLSKNGQPLTRFWVWEVVKKAAVLAGITKNIYPHLLRHSFASHLLGNGADLRVIQEMLGHADIGTTQIYTHTDQNSLIRAHRQFHPRG